MVRPVFLILFLFASLAANNKARAWSYEYTSNCDRAYQSFLSLRLNEGRDYILNEAKSNPGNLLAVYVADYEDCVLLLLNCNQTDYDQRRAHFDERLNLLDKGDKNSPWYRLCKAGLYLHWAIIQVRFGNQYKAAINFHKSFSLLNENQALFPNFEYNNVFAGLEEAVVGALPGNYKWVASVFGMKGNIKEGTAKIAAFMNTHNPGQPFYNETVLYYAYVRFYLLAEQQEVWNFLNSSTFTHNNLLNVFVKANIGLDYRKADDVINMLKAASVEPEYPHYPIFNYQLGSALLTKLDMTAIDYFQQYLSVNRSDVFIKDAWQKIGLAYYLSGNQVKANYCLGQIKTNGSARIDADKQAYRFARNGVWPVSSLLQARLVIEGGYYERALSILNSISLASLTTPADKAEYYFRLGRTYEELAASAPGKSYYQQAIAQYNTAGQIGKDRSEQFAARSALQTGKIYERIGMKAEAISKYKECLNMVAHDFQNSIDQQAKAGINRVENTP